MQTQSDVAHIRASQEEVEWGVIYHRYHNVWRVTRAIPLPNGNSNVDMFGEYPTESAARAEAVRLSAKN